MKTSEERLNKTISFICELMKKERFYSWSVFDTLLAVKNCALTGSTTLPEERGESFRHTQHEQGYIPSR